jgi:hypothetical protein
LPSEKVPAPPSPNWTFDSGIELALAPQAPGVLGALAHGLAAFEDERPEAHLGQQQAGEQAAGAGADHHRSRCRRRCRGTGDKAVGGVGRRQHVAVAAQPGQHRFLVLQFEVERVGEDDGGGFARIVAAAEDRVAGEVPGGDAEPLDDGAAQFGFAVVEG